MHQVGAGVESEDVLVQRFDSLDDHLRAKIVNDLDDFRQYASNPFVFRRLYDQRAVELDDVGRQPPQTVEVRVLATEVVNRNAKSPAPIRVNGILQTRQFVDARLKNFEHDLCRL